MSHATNAQSYYWENNDTKKANATKQEEEFEHLMKERGPAEPR